ncbi:hypothetical protein [Glaciimonas sp. PCH181]|uniref:hypothetical protein n=1 Tax=Glaciimonas sp. PCH181 TaxID=2133943 RepID=UPI000D339BCA|nr:hypothetical protein [Glaciimonas sp. PCH181]PUA17318.1 hypothetical protein C7W93_15445 [Glaciimonas sp. PCH181]
MRISQYFKLNKEQPYLDFVDIRLDTDLAVFVDPGRLRSLQSTWATECLSLIQDYFDTVLKKINNGDDEGAINLLSCLKESNDFHFGFSKGKSRGNGMGDGSAHDVWGALTKSKASITGLLQDLEDTCLLIDGIGPDRISDAVCNILRGPLIQYTQEVCNYYGIELTPDVASGPVWNPDKELWEERLIALPMTEYGRVILVPKIIVRHQIWYDSQEYYRYYLLPHMQSEEKRLHTALVETLKDGRTRVTKKSLMHKYGADKLAVVEQTLKHPSVLDNYREAKKKRFPKPMDHETLADIETTPPPDFALKLKKLSAVPPGRDHATVYENLIEEILSALFYPCLTSPTKQHNIHEGRKRIDLTYVNSASSGFFAWLAMHYPSGHIFIECKNFSSDISNPELDQLSGRFSPSRGRVGLLLYREIDNREKFIQRCIDTAKDDRGFIIPLGDTDLAELIGNYLENPKSQAFSHLKSLFNRLIM